MPGEAIIGKVAVKVVPDTTGFKQELETQLERIERSLDDLDVKITPHLDEKAVVAEAARARKNVEKALGEVTLKVNLDDQNSIGRNLNQLNNQLDKLRETFELEVDFANLDDVMTAIDLLEERMKEVEHIQLQVDEGNDGSVAKAIKAIDAEIAKLGERPIDVKLDEDSLFAERERLQLLLDAGDAIRMDIEFDKKKAQEALDALELQAKLDLEANAAAELLAKSNAALAFVQRNLDDLEINYDVDRTKIEETRQKIEAELLKFHDLTVKLDAELDPLAARKILLEMEAVKSRIRDLKVDINPDVDNVRATIVDRVLAFLARDREVQIKPVLDNRVTRGFAQAIDRLSGHRLASEQFGELTKFLANLDLAIPKIAKFGVSLFGMGAAVTASLGALFALSQELAQIANLGFAVPGLFASVAASVAVAVIAFKDFGTRLPDITQKFSELRDLISNNFWDQAERSVRSAFNFIFPQLREGVGQISTAMGGFVSEFALALGEVLENNGRLKGMFRNVAAGWDSLSDHAGAFANIIAVLGTAGAEFFNDLMHRLGDASEGWAAWLLEAEKTGKLKEMIDGAWNALVNVGRVLVNTVQIFDAIGDAAHRAFGTDLLGGLANGLDRIEKMMHGRTFQKELTNVFKASGEAMQEISDRAGPAVETAFRRLSRLVQDVFPDVGATIGEVMGGVADAFNTKSLQNGLRDFFRSVKGFAEQMRPAFDDIGKAVGDVFGTIAVGINTAAPGVEKAISTISNAIGTIAVGLRPVVEILGGAFNDLMSGLAPVITDVADAFANMASGGGADAIKTLTDAIVPLLTAIGDFGGGVLEDFFNWLDENGPKIADAFKPAIDGITQFIKDHGPQIQGIIRDLLDNLTPIATSIGDIVSDLIDMANGPLKPIFDFLIWLVGSALGLLLKLVAKALELIALALDELNKQMDKGKTITKDLIDGIAEGDTKKTGKAIKQLDIWELLTHPGELIGGGLEVLNNDNSWDALKISFSNQWNDVVDFWGSTIGLSGKELQKKWASLFDGLKLFVSTKWQEFKDFFGGLLSLFEDDTVVGAGSPAGGPGKSGGIGKGAAGPGPFQGIRDAFQAAIDDMKLQLDNFKSTISQAWTDIQTAFTTAGQTIKTGLDTAWQSIKDAASTAWEAIKTWFSTNVWEPIKNTFSTALGNIQTTLSTAWENIKSTLSTAWENIKTSVSTAFENIKTAVSTKIGEVIEYVRGIPGRVVAALGDLGKTLIKAGRNLIDGLISGIQSGFERVKSTLSSLTSLLPSWKGPPARDKSLLYDAGRLVMNGFVNGLESQYKAVRESLGGLSQDVARTPFVLGAPSLSRAVAAAASGALDVAGGTSSSRTLIYHAAPGNTLSSEDDLFRAAARARMGW